MFFSYSSGPRINVLQALRQDIADEIVAKFTLFTRSKGELRAFTLRIPIRQSLPTPGFTLVLSYVTMRNTVWISNKLNNPDKSYDIQKP